MNKAEIAITKLSVAVALWYPAYPTISAYAYEKVISGGIVCTMNILCFFFCSELFGSSFILCPSCVRRTVS